METGEPMKLTDSEIQSLINIANAVMVPSANWWRTFTAPVIQSLLAEIKDSREQIRVEEELLNNRNKLLDAIPECSEHGHGCIPHALEWIERAKKVVPE